MAGEEPGFFRNLGWDIREAAQAHPWTTAQMLASGMTAINPLQGAATMGGIAASPWVWDKIGGAASAAGGAVKDFFGGIASERPPQVKPKTQEGAGKLKVPDKVPAQGQPPGGGMALTPDQQLRAQLMARLEMQPDILKLGSGSSTRINPEAYRALSRAEKARQQYAAAMGAEGGAVSKAIAASQAATGEKMARLDARGQATEAEIDQGLEAQRKAIAEIENAGIDPDRWWSDRSSANKVVAILASGLGGIAEAAGTGRGNKPLQIINRLIERDVRAQERELNQKQVGLQARGNMLGLLTQKLGSIEAGKAALMQYQRANIALDLQRIGAQFQGTKKSAEMSALSNELLSKTAAQEKSVSAWQETPNAQKMAGMAALAKGEKPGKPLPVGATDAIRSGEQFVYRARDLAQKLKGANLSKLSEVFSAFGTDAATIGPQVNEMARAISKNLGTKDANMSEKDAEDVIGAIKGKQWGNKAQHAMRRLITNYMRVAQKIGKQVRDYRTQGYNVGTLQELETFGDQIGKSQKFLQGLKAS